MSEPVPATLLSALGDLVNWLETAKIPSIIIGGIAVSVLGRPRLTQDIDVLANLHESEWTNAVGAAERHGILPRIDSPTEFAKRSRVLLLRHTATGIDLDITISGISFERAAIDRSQIQTVEGIRFRLPCIEDLIVMKAVAGRAKDLQDIEGLLESNPDADIHVARQWIREFSTVMTMPDMLIEFDKLVARTR